MKGIHNTSTENFSSIIGTNKKFIVPKFQRDYSWDYEQWDDLWQDICTMIKSKDEHYMGYLVLQTTDNKSYYIIDGQQRFTTITMLILSAIKAIKCLAGNGIETDDNNKRVSNLLNTYIGNENPITLEYDNILILNRNNDPYYKDYIVRMEELRIRNTTTTEKLMRKAFEFFEGKVKNSYKDGKDLALFIQNVVDNLFFTTIIVNDELNAFRVFETLNARGVQLSSADLLKNYLFSLVDANTSHQENIMTLENRWSELTNNVKTEKLPEFLRYYWNSSHKLIRANDVFKTIRKEITTDAEVFRLIKDMRDYSDIYMALKNGEDDLWENDSDVKLYISLLNLFNLKQPFSLLMAAKKSLSKDDFKKALRAIIIICFRYNIIGDKNPNELERAFNEISMDISSTKKLNFHLFKKMYIDDEEFSTYFKNKSFPNLSNSRSKIVRYILSKIEYASGNFAVIDYEDDKNSIEHILPQSPDESWGIDSDVAEGLASRLGNLCLLEKSKNKDLGNKLYDEKKAVYSSSSFVSTSSIPDSFPENWNEQTIASRQANLARMAKSIWSITF